MGTAFSTRFRVKKVVRLQNRNQNTKNKKRHGPIRYWNERRRGLGSGYHHERRDIILLKTKISLLKSTKNRIIREFCLYTSSNLKEVNRKIRVKSTSRFDNAD